MILGLMTIALGTSYASNPAVALAVSVLLVVVVMGVCGIGAFVPRVDNGLNPREQEWVTATSCKRLNDDVAAVDEDEDIEEDGGAGAGVGDDSADDDGADDGDHDDDNDDDDNDDETDDDESDNVMAPDPSNALVTLDQIELDTSVWLGGESDSVVHFDDNFFL
jgi:hypothetical protein